jgi:hypothetical protein
MADDDVTQRILEVVEETLDRLKAIKQQLGAIGQTLDDFRAPPRDDE